MTLYPSTGCSMLTTRARVLRAKTSYLRVGEGGGKWEQFTLAWEGLIAYVLLSLCAYGDGRVGAEGENDQFSNVYMVQRENRSPRGRGVILKSICLGWSLRRQSDIARSDVSNQSCRMIPSVESVWRFQGSEGLRSWGLIQVGLALLIYCQLA